MQGPQGNPGTTDWNGITNKPATFAPTIGATGATAVAGNDPRLGDSRAPNGSAGGDLTGTYPNPTIAAGKTPPLGAATTSATTGTMTVNMITGVVTITPTGACTFNASGGVAGQLVSFIVTTSGVSSFVLTFGTNFKSAGTLATGTTTGKKFSVTFRCVDGTTWQEIGRTAAM